jgi:18S rRNA (adenine1779-N6/adenine1780-N6)-dimethyltransferase
MARLGQHFLRCPATIARIVERAAPRPTDLVYEIGPGGGALTKALLPRCGRVVAAELDKSLLPPLRAWAQGAGYSDRLELVHGDAQRLPVPPGAELVVANIPYAVSSPLLRLLLRNFAAATAGRAGAGAGAAVASAGAATTGRGVRTAVLLVQREFAQRLMARPGDTKERAPKPKGRASRGSRGRGSGGGSAAPDGAGAYGALSLDARMLAEVELVADVGRELFDPPPRVDSAVVALTPRSELAAGAEAEQWLLMTKLCFTRRNKTLRAILRSRAAGACFEPAGACLEPASASGEEQWREQHWHRAAVEAALAEAGLLEGRAAKLGVDDFAALLRAIHAQGLRFRTAQPR